MKKQKICIIGGSLTGLVTAISLAKLNCEIDLIMGDTCKNLKSNRTVAISESNINFLNNLNISKSLKREAWPCSIIKLYTEDKNQKFSEIFELNKDSNPLPILYMLENLKITKLMENKIKQIKSISTIRNKLVSGISNSGLLKNIKIGNNYYKYNLIIICTGHNSNLVRNIFNEQIVENFYNEVSITTIIKHNSLKNNTARQVFLKKGILALLPISNTRTSIVFSVKKEKDYNDLIMKNKILSYVNNYLKGATFETNTKCREINFLIRNKYYKDRILLFGDALHMIHPFVGQGFNMTIRDLSCLEKMLQKKIGLGLDIGSLDILSEFSSEIKPRNFAFSVSTDLLRNFFSYNEFRNPMLKILNKNHFLKNIFFGIANKGFEF